MNLKKKFFFITKKRFFKNIEVKANRKSGINFSGNKTTRSRGFINKKKKRIIDNFRGLWHIKAYVLNFEYDPNRKTLISLIVYLNGIFAYDISLEYFSIGMSFYNGNKFPLFYGCSTILKNIPKKIKLCNLEVNKLKGFKFLKASGSHGKIIFKNNRFCLVKLKSKKVKKIFVYCNAVVGSVLNFNFNLNKYKKASYSRYKGFRPKVRGVAMNPIDHPHGGGEGKKSKKSNPMSPWGKKLNFKKIEKKR